MENYRAYTKPLQHTHVNIAYKVIRVYVMAMTDHISMLKGKIERAEAKVQRYQKSLETAENELSDLQTALRVLEGLSNASESNASGTSTTMGRQLNIVRLLGVGQRNGQSPADLYAAYCRAAAEDITIDTFRTTIWRMKGKVFEIDDTPWEVHAGDGAYWKVDASHIEPQQTSDFDELLLSREVQKEEEPRSVSAGGSSADRSRIEPTVTVSGQTPTWPTITRG